MDDRDAQTAAGKAHRPNTSMSSNARPWNPIAAMANGNGNGNGNGNDVPTQSQRPLGTNTLKPWSNPWPLPSPQTVPPTEDGFPTASGSSALASKSEAETWSRQPWNKTDPSQTRNTSSNASPNRARDAVHRHQTSSSSFLKPSQLNTQPAIGQRGGMNNTSLWNGPRGFETSSNLNLRSQSSQYAEHRDEQLAGAPFGQNTPFEPDGSGRGLRGDNRGSHDPYPDLGGSPFAHGNSLADTLQATVPRHSQRGSTSGLSGPFSGIPTNTRTVQDPSNDNEAFEDRFNRSLSFNDGALAQAHPSEAGIFSTFTSDPSVRAFQLNPGTQPWNAGRVEGNGNFDTSYYALNGAGVVRNNLGGIPDGGSPASSVYRQTIGSPRRSAGSPQSALSYPLSRPASRDTRAVLDTRQRGPGHHMITQDAAHVAPQLYYDGNLPAPHQVFNSQYIPAINLQYMHGAQYSPHRQMNLVAGMGGHTMRPTRDNDPADAARSPLLKEFRRNSKTNRQYELRDITGHIAEFCGDPDGSRFIQDKLKTANSDEKQQVFAEIEPNAVQLMMDIYGNYVVQRLYEQGSGAQKQLLTKAMKGRVLMLSQNHYGSRVLQTALRHIFWDQQVELLKELEPDLLEVMKNEWGNHVVQKAMEFMPHQHTVSIFLKLQGRVKELASDGYGCRVLQKAMDYGSDGDRARIIKEIQEHCYELTDDPYGNYVVQHVLKKGRPEDRTPIINSVLDEVIHFSKHKYASNVVEECFKHATPEKLLQVQAKMTKPGPDGTPPLRMMVIDLFGNFVIQKFARWTPDLDGYREALRPHVQWASRNHTFKNPTALPNLWAVLDKPIEGRRSPPKNGRGSTSSTSPLQLDVGSAAPTPNLTMGPNSPSSSPPSTNESALDEPVEVATKTRTASVDGVSRSPEVLVHE